MSCIDVLLLHKHWEHKIMGYVGAIDPNAIHCYSSECGHRMKETNQSQVLITSQHPDVHKFFLKQGYY